MATLSDENTTAIGRNLGRLISALMKLLYRNLLKWLEQRAEKNFRQLEKRNPQRIQNADLDREHLDKFKILAHQKGINKYKIENKHDVPTIKYDIKDEHEINEIFKQIENGYRIPENELMAIMERYTDTNLLANRIQNILHYQPEEIQQEMQNPEHYQEEKVLNQDIQEEKELQEIYDRNVKEVTGKENTEKLDMSEMRENSEKSEQPITKNELDERLEKLKEKHKENQKENKTKERNKQKQKGKSKSERER